ncbi:uncharacterized protein LOC124147880 isoform X2 [Haliotis rufescens]|uniref:uncharacterized protein LOC124147880 isoform X2 n=1 Tax=Haliotis rufescens TaxID=6454 RepID=UPI00201F5B03|nr:uncharacterized protein LOC124147880 isoform X2 [Haliotis rufescens]
MAAVLKLCVVLICLGLVESLVRDCFCDVCTVTERVSFKKPICPSTTYRQRYTTSCGFLGWSRCTRYRTGYRRACTGYTIGYKNRFVSCRPGCTCPKGPIPRCVN